MHASPNTIEIDTTRSAFVVIDMQRDFLEPGGFGESLGNQVDLLRGVVNPCRAVLALSLIHI